MADGWCYQHNGRLWPRVSSILDILADPDLDKWRQRIGQPEAAKVSEAATKRGTATHRMIAERLAGKKPRLTAPSSESRRAYDVWCQWYEAQRDFRPSRIETTLYSEEGGGYAGTVDCIEDSIVAGHNTLTDWKIASRTGPKYILQLNGYVPLAFPGWKTMPTLPMLRVLRIDPVLGMFNEWMQPADPTYIKAFTDYMVPLYRQFWLEPALVRMKADRQALDAMEETMAIEGEAI